MKDALEVFLGKGINDSIEVVINIHEALTQAVLPEAEFSSMAKDYLSKNGHVVIDFYGIHITVNCFANMVPVAVRSVVDEKLAKDLISLAISLSLLSI